MNWKLPAAHQQFVYMWQENKTAVFVFHYIIMGSLPLKRAGPLFVIPLLWDRPRLCPSKTNCRIIKSALRSANPLVEKKTIPGTKFFWCAFVVGSRVIQPSDNYVIFFEKRRALCYYCRAACLYQINIYLGVKSTQQNNGEHLCRSYMNSNPHWHYF